MAILDTALDSRAPSYLDNRSTAMAALSRLETVHAQARDGGGEREVTRHHARGKLLPRERIELLVDRDTALLELAATAGLAQGEPAGAGVVTALGLIEHTECMLVANDPTVREGGLSPAARRKLARAAELAGRHGLPLILLLESTPKAGHQVSPPDPDLVEPARLSTPLLCAVFGQLDAGLAPLPELADHTIVVRGQAGAGRVDVIAEDERDALRLLRQTVRRLVPRSRRRHELDPAAPRFETEELVAVVSADPRQPADIREVLARVLDSSAFDEFRPQRGAGLVTGFGAVHGLRVAVLANTVAKLDPEAAEKGTELVRLATNTGMPVLVLANPVTRPEHDQSSSLLRALARADRITVVLGVDPAAWALAGPGFRLAWPVGDLSADPYDGVIDPRDTRTVLGICLSVSSYSEVMT